MKRAIRLIKEGIFALTALKNPWVYIADRFGWLGEQEVMIKMWNGAQYWIRANTNHVRMIDEIWRMKVYDPLLSQISRGGTVLDIGANIGIFSIKAARQAPDVRVISYEPFPSNFALLKKNIIANNVSSRATAVQEAIAGKQGALTLFSYPQDSGGVSMYEYGDQGAMQSTRVPAVPLADVFAAHRITACDYIKMDCEGAEKDILLNTPDDVFARVKSWSIEWHEVLHGMSAEEGKALFASKGYQAEYNPDTYTLYARRS